MAKLQNLLVRQCDRQGCGFFGASRGNRDHNGIDLICDPDTIIECPVEGVVSKLGYPYAENTDTRYVEVKVTNPFNGESDYFYRFFYITPACEVGDKVNIGNVLGYSQELESMTRGGQQHIHFEVKQKDSYIDPTPIYLSWQGRD